MYIVYIECPLHLDPIVVPIVHCVCLCFPAYYTSIYDTRHEKTDFFWYDTDFFEFESFDFKDHIPKKPVSYQEKDGRGHAATTTKTLKVGLCLHSQHLHNKLFSGHNRVLRSTHNNLSKLATTRCES